MFTRDFTRRDFVRMSVASAFGAAACPWLPVMAAAAEKNADENGKKKPTKACIVLWMSGGPSQTDTWDLKVGHKNGGPSKETATAVTGLRFSEHLKKLAEAAKELGIIRSMTTKEGEHGRATQLLHTGQLPSEQVAYPAIGSLFAKAIGDPEHDLPSYITISQGGLNANIGAGFLGPQYAPMAVSGISDNPSARANLSIDYLKPDRAVAASDQDVRRQLLADLQGDFEKRHGGEAAKSHAASYRKAQKMIDTEAKGGFRLDEEPAKLRDAYGRSRFGQGCLLARRLLERGVSFVEVTLDGWDTHIDNFNQVKTLSETLDPAFATLLSDLKDRGMLENTLVVWMGEFGRTPIITPQNGRDHFPVAWSTVLAGAGVKGGQAVGSTGKDGMTVTDKPVGVADFLATVFTAVGIDPTSENKTWDGRPIPLVKGGTAIEELVK
jgi:uncharacterized protein (DUF1501 family)